jgi:hypothetical protein
MRRAHPARDAWREVDVLVSEVSAKVNPQISQITLTIETIRND